MKTVLSFFALLAIAGAVLGDTIGVCPEGCDFDDIQAAIDAAKDGDVIEIAAGTYQPTETLDLHGKAVTLSGALGKAGYPETLIDGQHSIQLIQMTSGEGEETILQNLEFTRGSGESGAAIYCEGASPIIRFCAFNDNSASLAGGGIYCFGSSPKLVNCTFTNNTSSFDGGGACNLQSTPTYEWCVFQGNTASGGSGGGMVNYASSDAILKRCTFLQNSASSQGGGGMYNSTSTPVLEYCVFQENTTTGEGAGMFNYQSSPTILFCTFDSNAANNFAGGIGNRDDSSPMLIGSVFTSNTAAQGGAMRNRDSSPTFEDCTFVGNVAEYDGGGIASLQMCNLTLKSCVFQENSAGSFSGGGGGIFTNGMRDQPSSVALIDCLFTANNTIGGGGGLLNNSFYSQATLEGCEFASNTAGYGTGIANIQGSISTISNCAFTECCAVDPITTAIDQGGNHTLYICVGCEGDVNCDGEVSASDLGRLISAWGPSTGRYDLNADGDVNGTDLGILFATWGVCP